MKGQRTDVERYGPCQRMREARGWSQVRLAGIAGVGVVTISHLEHAEYANMTVATLVRVANALGCSVVDLVPALAVRHSSGGRVQAASTGQRRASGRARRELARRTLVEVLERLGGRALAADVVAQMGEQYRISRRLAVEVRKELGAEGRVVAEQLRGVRPGLLSWQWTLVSAAPEQAVHH